MGPLNPACNKLASEVCDLALDAADTLGPAERGAFLSELCRQLLEQVEHPAELGALDALVSAQHDVSSLCSLLHSS